MSIPRRPRKRFLLPVIFALLGVAALLFVFFLVSVLRPHIFSTSASTAETPVGAWETRSAQRQDGSARLEFVLRSDGTGLFSWQTTGAAANAGQEPLVWSVNAEKRLALHIATPKAFVPGDTAARTLIEIFNSHPWRWRADRAQHRLILGNLTLIEKEN